MEATLDKRREALQREIRKYLGQGYHVVSQSDTTAQLVKPKTFSLLWALIWLLCFGVGLIVYLLYYWSKKDTNVYLEVDNFGNVRKK